MNLSRLIKSLLIVVLLVASMVTAQEGSLLSVVKIDGITCVASSKEEFEILKSLAGLITAMRQAKANGTIDSTFYAEKVASFMEDARSNGIRMKKNN